MANFVYAICAYLPEGDSANGAFAHFTAKFLSDKRAMCIRSDCDEKQIVSVFNAFNISLKLSRANINTLPYLVKR